LQHYQQIAKRGWPIGSGAVESDDRVAGTTHPFAGANDNPTPASLTMNAPSKVTAEHLLRARNCADWHRLLEICGAVFLWFRRLLTFYLLPYIGILAGKLVWQHKPNWIAM